MSMPPPNDAELPKMVEFVTVRMAPLLFSIAPPNVAELLERVELAMLRMPELLKAPPKLVVFAPEIVTPEMDKSLPESILKMLKLRFVSPLSPLMINEEATSPVIVRAPALEVAAIAGSADCRVIVLVPFVNSEDAKTISSLALVALAASIACLNEPSPESALVVTVYCTSVRLALL